MSGFGFSKDYGLFVGRVVQLGFAAGLIGKAITGKGALAQSVIESGEAFEKITIIWNSQKKIVCVVGNRIL